MTAKAQLVRYGKMTMEELQAARAAIESDPASQSPPGSFYRFTPRARSKIEAITWAITHLMREARVARAEGREEDAE